MMKTTAMLTLFLIATTLSSLGQDTSIGITKAELSCKLNGANLEADKLQIMLDKSIRSILLEADATGNCAGAGNPSDECKKYRDAQSLMNDLQAPGHYRSLKLSDGTSIALAGGAIGTILQNTLIFTVGSGYDLNEKYILIARYTDVKKSNPQMIKIEPTSSCESITTSDNLPKPEKPKEDSSEPLKLSDIVKKPESKESPVWDFEFGLDGAKKKKSVYSFKSDFRPFRRRRLGLGGYYDWTHIFMQTEVRFNTSEKDRKNVLTIGSEFSLNRVFHKDGDRFKNPDIEESKSRFPGLSLVYAPKVETEWGFKEVNILPVDIKGKLPINLYQSRSNTFRIDPYIGFESGWITRTENSKPGWKIARPLVGADLIWGILRKDDKPRIAIEMSYIRRFFLKPELSYGVNDAGNEIPDRATRRARDHGTATITFNAGLFSPFVKYEYGRIPPKYILQNSTFKTGIHFNIDLWWKKFL